MNIRIATRKSALALWQAEHVRSRLQEAHPGLAVELVTMSTKGDRVLDSPLAKIGGKGLFLKELEEAMLRGDAHMAVHSLKDVPTVMPEALPLVAITERDNTVWRSDVERSTRQYRARWRSRRSIRSAWATWRCSPRSFAPAAASRSSRWMAGPIWSNRPCAPMWR